MADVCVNNGMDPHGAVDLLLTDPPYNTIAAQDLPSFEYYSLTTNDTVVVVELAVNVAVPRGHGHIC